MSPATARRYTESPPDFTRYKFLEIEGIEFTRQPADIFTTLEYIQEASDGAALAAVEAPGGETPVLYEL